MAYFHISAGLRGCYMPDNTFVIRVATRRELKETLEYEARDLRDAGFVGLNQSSIARLAAQAWRSRKQATLDYVAPYRAKSQDYYPYGLFCSAATRQDYLEWREEA